VPEVSQDPRAPERRRRSGAVRAALAVMGMMGMLLAGGVSAGLAEDPPRQPWKKLSGREARYLQGGLEQIRRMKGHFDFIGWQPLASGALAAAALASQGGPEAPKLREEAARFTAGALDGCAGKWSLHECPRAQLPLQRLALQYPGELPPALLARLRGAVADSAPPPGEGLIQNPWSFADTENQRMVTLARSLVGQVVAGTPDSPTARGWGAFAEAFLQAHDRDGWYEAESPGYLALSITGLLQLADFAPRPAVRELARRQLDGLFTAWAQEQVGGFPAGAKSRTSSAWALSPQASPWQAWAWLAAGIGDPGEINFMDRPELPVSRYQIPAGAVRRLADRRRQPPYEIRARRKITPAKRHAYEAALYAYATPDYILGVSQTVGDLALRVSGGQEIVATLYAESPAFAPLYLWSRTRMPESDEGQTPTRDQAVADKNVALVRLDTPEAGVGHAFLAPAWSAPEAMGDVVVSRCGDTYVALVTQGGWEIAPALAKYPDSYGAGNRRRRDLAGSWVAVPRRQPASVALVAGRRAEDGDFAAWKKRAAAARLAVGEDGEIHFTGHLKDGAATRFDFLPGVRAAVAGKTLDTAYPRRSAP
jgi:hypothetical protein